MRHRPKIKFGVRITKDHHEALEFDKNLGNTLWKEATKVEMDRTYEYKAYKSLCKGDRKPKDHQDRRHNARFVAGGHTTGPNIDTYYSSVVSLRAMGMMSFLAELNDMELIAADIGNVYLEAYTDEKICFIA
eukprot:5256508-Ditylum_brightwellii.AAC.1